MGKIACAGTITEFKLKYVIRVSCRHVVILMTISEDKGTHWQYDVILV